MIREIIASLHEVIKGGNIEVTKLLIEHNANVNKADEYGQTPLYMAAGGGHLETVKLLIEHNADVNKSNFIGVTPLYRAAAEGHLDIVKLLLEHNADVNKADKYGHIPLYLAAQRGHLEMLKLLIEHNATVYMKTSYGKTVLDVAMYGETTRLLKEAMKMKIPWSPQRHHLYPPEVRQQISTIFKMSIKQPEFSKLPKEILFIIFEFVATWPFH